MTDVAIAIGPIFVVIALPIVVTSTRMLCAVPGLVVNISLGPILPAIAIPKVVSAATSGFIAVTISLGILTSMFTATVVVRMMMGLWYRSRRPKLLPV